MQLLCRWQLCNRHSAALVIVHRTQAAGLVIPDSQLARKRAKAAGNGQFETGLPGIRLQCRKCARHGALQAMAIGQCHQMGFIQSGQLPGVERLDLHVQPRTLARRSTASSSRSILVV